MDIAAYIQSPIVEELDNFKQMFDQSLQSSTPLLTEVTTYIRQRKGKMMRPVLILLMAKLYGKIQPATYHAAVSLELLHTASLLHDDVVDESCERRGQDSVNEAFNNKIAVLVGDYLLATCLLEAEKTHIHHIIETVSRLGQHLAEGEILQISDQSDQLLSEKVYYEVIRKKTAALFGACTRAAALSVGSGMEDVDKATRFGEYIGLCFQIRDDIFDYYDNSGIGKATHHDMLERRLTLPILYAINSTNDEWAKATALKVKEGEATADEMEELTRFAKEHGGIEYAQNIMKANRQEAYNLIAGFPESDTKKSLIAYLDYVIDRKK